MCLMLPLILIIVISMCGLVDGAYNPRVFFRKWFDQEVDAVERINPGQFRNFTFRNERLTDLCEVNMNRSGCWEGQDSRYQRSVVIDTGKSYGKQLFLDCQLQSSEADEFIYHEALTHPALVAHPKPRRVFIAGGGEGGTPREVLRHRDVEEVIMVDLDGALVAVTEARMSYWDGVKADPRFTLHVGDAMEHLRLAVKKADLFDVVIFDLPDAVRETAWLYSMEIYKLVKQVLHPGGLFATHSGGDVCVSGKMHDGYPEDICRTMPRLLATLKTVWANASVAVVPLPTWQEFHGFMYASDGIVPHQLGTAKVKQLLEKKLRTAQEGAHPNLVGERNLRYYGAEIHERMHQLQPPYKKFLHTQHEILTSEAIKRIFKDWGPGYDGLTEMVKCPCDPSHCLFRNGLKGPLRKYDDVYDNGERWDNDNTDTEEEDDEDEEEEDEAEAEEGSKTDL